MFGVMCAMVSGMVDGGMVSHGVVGGSSGRGMLYCMVAWCLVWLMVAWCLVSWMAALMVGGGVGTNVMANGDNVSVVMWCVGGKCMCYGVCAYPTAI